MRWDVDPVLIDFGPAAIRWYGFFFVVGLLLSIRALEKTFKRRGLPREHAYSLSLWLPIGMIVGAHLGHLIFYDPKGLLDPMKLIKIGYGLASHGGAAGVLLALLFFCRRKRVGFHRYADAAMVAAVWLFPWVRLGNFFNSEIYGLPTDRPWGVIFLRSHETVARHPSQLYEALLGVALILVGVWLDRRWKKIPVGATLYGVLLIYFCARFLLEYFKEWQVFSEGFPLRMGQILSLPAALACLLLLLWRIRVGKTAASDGPPAASDG